MTQYHILLERDVDDTSLVIRWLDHVDKYYNDSRAIETRDRVKGYRVLAITYKWLIAMTGNINMTSLMIDLIGTYYIEFMNVIEGYTHIDYGSKHLNLIEFIYQKTIAEVVRGPNKKSYDQFEKLIDLHMAFVVKGLHARKASDFIRRIIGSPIESMDCLRVFIDFAFGKNVDVEHVWLIAVILAMRIKKGDRCSLSRAVERTLDPSAAKAILLSPYKASAWLLRP